MDGFKRLCLDQLKEDDNHYHFFDYFLKLIPTDDTLQCLLKRNDDINAAFQVVSTTLMILKGNDSLMQLVNYLIKKKN